MASQRKTKPARHVALAYPVLVGLDIPHDVAVLGMEDDPTVCEFCRPTLSSVSELPAHLLADEHHERCQLRPWHPARAKDNGGWRCPAERLNKHRYHENWLENLLASGFCRWMKP